MAHCPYDLLTDISGALDRLRTLPGIVERKPGIFYIKGDGFLHFHIKDGERWADVKPKRGGGWERIPLPLNANAAAVGRFTRAVEKAHKSYVSG